MKLYTEEQVRKAMLALNDIKYMYHSDDDIFDSLTPIELPSDEEIEDKGKWIFNNDGHTIFTHYNTVPSWINGAKWVIEKIKQQENGK